MLRKNWNHTNAMTVHMRYTQVRISVTKSGMKLLRGRRGAASPLIKKGAMLGKFFGCLHIARGILDKLINICRSFVAALHTGIERCLWKMNRRVCFIAFAPSYFTQFPFPKAVNDSLIQDFHVPSIRKHSLSK